MAIFIMAGSFIIVIPSFLNLEGSDNTLTIYTYDSLLVFGADPEATLQTIFDDFGEQEEINVTLKLFSDANELLTRLKLEKSSPQADIVIGLDNALIALAKGEGIVDDILEPYVPSNIDNIPQILIDSLDPNFYLTPYDYGIIAFYYQKNIESQLTNLTLNDFVSDSSLAKKLVLSNPLHSSPGTAFLLWTIAVYDKILGQDWKTFWNGVKNNINIQNSWGDAFNVWSSDPTRSIMLSYGQSPAYDNCVFGDSSTSAILTHENDKQNTWLQIEGIGLVKGNNNPNIARKFIDHFISLEVQNLVPENNWMYPAHKDVQLSSCFQEASIDLNLKSPDINILNELISPSELQSNLANWLDEWRITVGVGLNLQLAEFLKLGIDLKSSNHELNSLSRSTLSFSSKLREN